MKITLLHSQMKCVFLTSMFAEAAALMSDLRWMVILIFALILVDYHFAKREVKMRGEDFRRSSAWRRSMNKFVDYICVLVLGGIIGLAVCQPIGICDDIIAGCIAMTFCIICEVISISGHIIYIKGWKISKKDVLTFIVSLLRNSSYNIGCAIDETIQQHEDEDNDRPITGDSHKECF